MVESASASTRLVVVVELEADPLRGVLQAPGEPDRPFAGWLSLISVLEGAIERLQERGSPRRVEAPAERPGAIDSSGPTQANP